MYEKGHSIKVHSRDNMLEKSLLIRTRGLCNGTRLILTKLYKNSIRCKILNGHFKDDEVLLSRCRLSTDSVDVSCKFQRIQISVKLAFAMTIN